MWRIAIYIRLSKEDARCFDESESVTNQRKIIEDHIIDRETFEKVQRLLLRDTRTGPQQNKLYLFSGFLKCADCGKAMTRSKVGDAVYYYCRT